MKKSMIVLAAILLCLGSAHGAEKKEEAKSETKKMVLVNFGKGDTFNNIHADYSLVEQHLAGKEKVRLKVAPTKEKQDYNGAVGMFGMSKGVDWSKFNYVVFNCFVEGDKPWSGIFMVGDKNSYSKWANNYASLNLVMKPGENKEVHVGIEGLMCSEANRALDMTNIQVLNIFPGDANPPTIYLGNLYLVNEEE